jgi:hypothetical protein
MSEILSGDVPFDSPEYSHLSITQFYTVLKQGARPSLPSWVLARAPWLAAVLGRAWALDPEERSSSVELVAEFEKHLGLHA